MYQEITIPEAVGMVRDGMRIMVGGFLTVGSAHKTMAALAESGVKDLTIICNDTAYDDRGIGLLIYNGQVSRVITSFIGRNPRASELLNEGKLEVEFVPQGTLIERIRCGGAGLGGVLTPTGVGTKVQEGKQVINVNGRDYLLETAIRADIALIGASRADTAGNLFYEGTARNFNPLMAMAADTVIAEPSEIVEAGAIPPAIVHTPGILVDYIVKPQD